VSPPPLSGGGGGVQWVLIKRSGEWVHEGVSGGQGPGGWREGERFGIRSAMPAMSKAAIPACRWQGSSQGQTAPGGCLQSGSARTLQEMIGNYLDHFFGAPL